LKLPLIQDTAQYLPLPIIAWNVDTILITWNAQANNTHLQTSTPEECRWATHPHTSFKTSQNHVEAIKTTYFLIKTKVIHLLIKKKITIETFLYRWNKKWNLPDFLSQINFLSNKLKLTNWFLFQYPNYAHSEGTTASLHKLSQFTQDIFVDITSWCELSRFETLRSWLSSLLP
jgi:hypothetical protein